MRARDHGTPPLVGAPSNVKVTVDRNSNEPKWDSNLKHEIKVNEDKAANSEILTLHASDKDRKVNVKHVLGIVVATELWEFYGYNYIMGNVCR